MYVQLYVFTSTHTYRNTYMSRLAAEDQPYVIYAQPMPLLNHRAVRPPMEETVSVSVGCSVLLDPMYLAPPGGHALGCRYIRYSTLYLIPYIVSS